jgi:NADH-quinone oxidoreductase subunit L
VLFSVFSVWCVFVFFAIALFSVNSGVFYLTSSTGGSWLSVLAGNGSQVLLDKTSILFILTVLFICFLTQIYSISYMYSDRRIVVFQLFLSIFGLSMCLLIISNSFTLFFLAWELIGISSFVLIGFLNERPYAVNAAIKALYVNRVPDMCLFSAFILLFLITGASDFVSATTAVKEVGINTVLFAVIFILILVAS